jgi:hypothetical protein
MTVMWEVKTYTKEPAIRRNGDKLFHTQSIMST